MEEGNEIALKKEIQRCPDCSRKKTAQMIPNFIGDHRSLSRSIEDAAASYGVKGVSGAPGGSESGYGTPATGSNAMSSKDVAVGVAAGAAAPAAAKNLGSRLFPWLGSASRAVLPAAAVAAPAIGAYMGANYIEELISSALAGSSKINPAIASDVGSLQAAGTNLGTLQKLIGRMQGMASHIDNKGIALAAAIGATQEKISKQQIRAMQQMAVLRNKN